MVDTDKQGHGEQRCHGALYKVFGGLQKTNEYVPKLLLATSSHRPFFVVGDSHVLSTAQHGKRYDCPMESAELWCQ